MVLELQVLQDAAAWAPVPAAAGAAATGAEAACPVRRVEDEVVAFDAAFHDGGVHNEARAET